MRASQIHPTGHPPELVVFWFRRDLREKDNRGLFEALKLSESLESHVLPIFIFDPKILSLIENKADSRVTFIFKQLEEINLRLKEFESSIQIYFDQPLKVFKELTQKYPIKNVITNEDYEPYALQRDTEVSDFLKSKNIAFKSYKDQVIFSPAECLKEDGTPYLIFTPYSKSWKKKLRAEMLEGFKSEKLLHRLLKVPPTQIKKLSDLGFETSQIEVPQAKIKKSTLSQYAEDRNFPVLKEGTTRIGVHLRFGTISIRHCVKAAQQHSEIWLNELIWREFFMMVLFHFPYSVDLPFKKKYSSIPWREDEADFAQWGAGMTGYPLVDAGMRELVATGFMHNRVRMVVASFLCKHLLLPWQWGERFFAEHLLDFELSSNVGNWQWCAGCGVDAAPYFRVFNPKAQAQKFDPEMKYILKWVPELKTSKYPEPMVDHEFARRRALKTYKENMES